jgi:hypothetical protein
MVAIMHVKNFCTSISFGVKIKAHKLKDSKLQHSNIVGGSSAKRVINCPGSVALVQKMPPKPSSSFAEEGTLLHDVISEYLNKDSVPLQSFVSDKLTLELMNDKLVPALALLDEVDPDKQMVYEVETRVGFGDFLPGVFGSTDLMGRLGNKAIILDWKFGSGVAVTAEENEQLMFYAAAAMRTPEAQWVFDGATEIELIIIQPPEIKRWTTTRERIQKFESDLAAAVKLSASPTAALKHGEHCRWCAAKPVCPIMTGAVDRAVALKFDNLDVDKLGAYLHNADLLETWIKDLRSLAEEMLKKGKPVPGWKMVPKRATRSWANEDNAKAALLGSLKESEVMVSKLISPAAAEKLLKKLPDGLTVSISSGNTIAPESDPRPAVVLIGQQLSAALSKIM